MFSPSLSDTVKHYYKSIIDNKQEEVVSEIFANLEKKFKSNRNVSKMDAVHELIFMTAIGYDTMWADFNILEVMSIEEYSAKHISYLAAEIMWNPTSDVVFMATNRIYRDLISSNPLIVSSVLSSLPSYITIPLGDHVMSDITKLFSSPAPLIRQKSISCFYSICMKSPESLKFGFQLLKSALDDKDVGVVTTVLTFFCEICRFSPSNFVLMIPKLYKMLEESTNEWMQIRLVTLMRFLCTAEPRLSKKLINPFLRILEKTNSLTLIYEIIITISQIPINDMSLILLALGRVENFIYNYDPTQRYICLYLLSKLISMDPKAVSQYREIIEDCLESEDTRIRLLALDILAIIVNKKSYAKVVSIMSETIKVSSSFELNDQIISRLIEISSKNDYEVIEDFGFYISKLFDIIATVKYNSTDILCNQILDLAERVPATRDILVDELVDIFQRLYIILPQQLILLAIHIVGEYSSGTSKFSSVFNNSILMFDNRIQTTCLYTAFRLYLRSKSGKRKREIESELFSLLPSFVDNSDSDVHIIASSVLSLTEILRDKQNKPLFIELKEKLCSDLEELPELIPPHDLDSPIPLFEKPYNPEIDEAMPASINSSSLPANSMLIDSIQAKNKTRHRPPVNGPEEHSRRLTLARNSSLMIEIEEYHIDSRKPGSFDIEFKIYNQSYTEITHIDFEMEKNNNVHSVFIPPIADTIHPSTSSVHYISFISSNTYIPQVIQMVMIPRNASLEVLPFSFKVFPSVFLLPSIAELPINSSKYPFTDSLSFYTNLRSREALQLLANILRCNIVEDHETKEKILSSMHVCGHMLIVSLKLEKRNANLKFHSNHEDFLTCITKEVKYKLSIK